MSGFGQYPPCPILQLSEGGLKHALRGFPEGAVAAALDLRQEFSPEKMETFLYGIFRFYLPSGTEVPEKRPQGEVLLREDLGLDSLSLAEAMFKIEELFGVRVENAEIAEVTTLTAAADLLLQKLDNHPGEVGHE